MYHVVKTPKGKHFESGLCPNAGSACNCPGFCRTLLVRDEDCECEGTGFVDRTRFEITSFKMMRSE